MLSRDFRDIVAGALLIVGGLLFSWYAWGHYDMGTLRRMGPGMFPAALGVLLAFFGLIVFIPAFFRQGEMPAVRIWSPLFVLLGVSVFALTIRPLGMLPAIVASTVVASFAELKVRPASLALLCMVLSVIAVLIFRIGLGLPIPMYRWPF